MSDYLCVWSTHAFSTWAGPGAILISQSRVGITFAFPPQSSKPPGLLVDMCTHFSGLPLCCLPCPMLIWILGFFYQKCVFGNLIYRISFSELVDRAFSTSPFLFFIFQRAALVLQLPAFSSQKTAVSQISFLSYDGKGVQCLLPPTTFRNLFS